MKTSKICCVFNYNPHYREEIYLKMDKELYCDFYFGDIEKNSIKSVELSKIKNAKRLKTRIIIGNWNWITNSIKLSFLKKYRQYILTGEPYCLSSWFILIINKILGKKTYLWTHGWYGNEKGIKKGIKKIYFELADNIFLYGDYAKKLMIKEGFSKNKLIVIYNSLNYEKQLKIRNDIKKSTIFTDFFSNDNPVLIFTGRLTKVKKLDQLLKVQSILLDKGIEVNVFIVGSGGEEENLKKIVKSNGNESNVYFYGPCYDEEKIANFYYNSAVCVSPGNVGLTGIHAMSYGCPVISHNSLSEQMPEFEVIENGETGFFFEKDNIKSLALNIEEILQLNRETLKTNCFKKIDDKFNTRFQMNLLKSHLYE